MNKLSLLFLIFSACSCSNSFKSGPTTFHVMTDAEVWDDLPEFMKSMRKIEGAPEDLFEANVYLYPGYMPLLDHWEDNVVCYYSSTTKDLHVRTLTLSAADSCLAHEFAHRWSDIEGLGLGHGDFFSDRKEALRRASCPGAWITNKACSTDTDP